MSHSRSNVMSLSNLTDEERYLLLKFSYIDLPPKVKVNPNNPLGFEDAVNRMISLPEYKDNPELIAIHEYVSGSNGENLGNLQLVGYQNNNPSFDTLFTEQSNSGFVGYAIQDTSGNAAALYRGSESLANPFHILTDWTSNVEAGVGQEIVQQQEAASFYEKFINDSSGEKFVLGHSKGGNLADYVFVNNLNEERLQAFTVNGAPLNWWVLSNAQQEALRSDRNRFIVHEGDFVSQLGYVDYVNSTIKTVQKDGIGEWLNPAWSHGLNTVAFNKNGDFNGASEGASTGRRIGNYIVSGIMLPLSYEALTDKAIASIKFATYNILIYSGIKVAGAIHEIENKMLQLKIAAIQYIFKVQKVSQALKQTLTNYFDQLIERTTKFLAHFGGRVSASGFSPEPYLKVDLSRLDYYSSRLQAIKRKTQHLNSMIDSLYGEAGLLGLDNVFKADILTTFHSRINDNIAYLNKTGELLEQTERSLAGKARSFY